MIPPPWTSIKPLHRLNVQGNSGLCGGVPGTMVAIVQGAADTSLASSCYWERDGERSAQAEMLCDRECSVRMPGCCWYSDSVLLFAASIELACSACFMRSAIKNIVPYSTCFLSVASAALSLLAWKATINDPAGVLANWTMGRNPCGGGGPRWPGIICSDWGMVNILNLNDAKLQGPLAGSLAALEGLQEIHLSGNALSGASGIDLN